MTTQESIKAFIVDELSFRGAADELDGSYQLIEKEAIDSMGIFQIVGFLEEEFDIEVADEDLVVENFASIDAISGMVERKKGT